MFEAGSKAISLAKRNPDGHKAPSILKFADLVLTVYDLHLIPTDKDGGMVLVSHSGLLQAIKQLTDMRWYTPVTRHDFVDIWQDYYDAVRAITVDNNSLRCALLGDAVLAKNDDNMVAKLHYTCKSHKPNGAVVLRPIHSYVKTPLAPGHRWLASQLDPILSQTPHLLKDSNDLMTRLKHLKVPAGCRAIKLDVKDFYLSGSHELIINKCSSLLPAESRGNFRLMASVVLHNQLVRSEHAHGLWRVVEGTGMGMIPSGSLSDATLYACMEKDFILKPSVRRRYQILFYTRFRDDILMLVNNDIDTIRTLLDEIRCHAHPFVITLDSISKSRFQMLDLDVSFSPTVSFELFTKPSSIWQPLSPESVHAPQVHKHWPLAQCKRIRSKFSSKKGGEQAVQHFKSLLFDSFGIQLAEGLKSSLPNISVKRSWLVMPYHRCLVMSKFGRVVGSLKVPLSMSFDKVRLSWKLSAPHLVHRLRRRTNNRNKGG